MARAIRTALSIRLSLVSTSAAKLEKLIYPEVVRRVGWR
jgi:hypothetical protein